MAGDLVFYAFALLTVLSGFFVAFSRNIVHAGFALLFTLFGVAGLYAMLGADFLAVAQVVVYIGGILVLVLFTVMMTRITQTRAGRRGLDAGVAPGIFALLLFALLYKAITGTAWRLAAPAPAAPTTAPLGALFLTEYLLAFEFASLLLLAAMIGAALVIRERQPVETLLEARRAGGAETGETAGAAGEPAGAAAGEVR